MKRDASELVDLHNGEFCVDVSEWGDVEYTPLEREQCDSTFEKKCEMKTEQVTISRYHILYNISSNLNKKLNYFVFSSIFSDLIVFSGLWRSHRNRM